ncbi:arylamine N-acetyltransferase family protein [Nitrolancea hollandica]|uniref:Putative N-hydroxyarylamine O-acetyltransferase n=1 Tax=Nitrolancea hollandica Lb TaxID=1129897 RepID=I4EJI0_9BACT|nr:arylamine N-acetyltransferase [Nitrolancea hollandica]CCF84842.1 putative N-hydroxyarylamine O-acetyltransferase [Nitrolancea hollandica Lb]
MGAHPAGNRGEHGAIDIVAYFERIGYTGSREPTAETLHRLHLSHVMAIPFENLDILLGRAIRLDIPSLQDKLVTARRGGYCHEQNMFFAAVLETLGFQVTRLAARVYTGATRMRPPTHMLLRVDIDDSSWVADVGFGGEGLLEPIPLVTGWVVPQFAWSYRLVNDGALWILQSYRDDAWHDLYGFTLEEHFPVDFELATYFTSTHPASPWLRNLVVWLPNHKSRWVLRNRELAEIGGRDSSPVVLDDNDSLLSVLAERFNLHFPPGTRFRFEPEPPKAERAGDRG